jgi:dTDP-4-dehydrorhamnose 3,5-epimerase
MRLTELEIPGAFVIEHELRHDERGYFAYTYVRDEFAQRGLNTTWAHGATAFNHRRGTLRGMHYQLPPHAEVKLIRCTTGAIFDVFIDLRPDSPAFGRWAAVELSASNHRMLYLPAGLAHGYQTLEDNSEVAYQISAEYHPELARGIRWDDEQLAIAWPTCDQRILSPRDREWPTFAQATKSDNVRERA